MGVELVKKSGQITLQKEMLRGDDGGYYTPSVDEDGNLTWTPSLEDMPEIAGANIKGDKGDKGDTGSVEWGDLTEEQIAALKGEKGDKGDDGYTPVKGVDYFDGEDGYTPVKGVDYFDGEDGKDGVDGKDGYTPVKGVDYFDGEDGKNGTNGATGADALATYERMFASELISGTNNVYLFEDSFFSRTPKVSDVFTAFFVNDKVTPNITYLTTFKVQSQYDDRYWKCAKVGYENRVTGTTGATGADGEDGITPHIGDNGNWFIGETDTGVAAQGETGATGATGEAGADGYTPVRGTDYWTDEDKAEIVAATVAALPVYEGEVV